MKRLLIIYPQWLPSNQVGVQRARLIVNFIERYGWKPTILAVSPEYYEEKLVPELMQTVKPGIDVRWCSARKVGKRRIIGDIALRAFSQLTTKAVEICRNEKIDFIWSPLPSFYTSLICRKVHDRTGVPYGLDYMDPWVHDFPGARFPNKAWQAKRVAQILEPVAVKKASLLTGVSALSYLPVIERNPKLKDIVSGYMPLGFDPHDFEVRPSNTKLLWEDDGDVLPVLYAGAFLPKAHYYVETMMGLLAELRRNHLLDSRVRFYFVGTGKGNLATVADYATKYGVSDIVKENTDRISFLEVLYNLRHAFGVLAIGNIEPHYTASKIFQTLISGNRVLPVFHCESTVNGILKDAVADKFLVNYHPEKTQKEFRAHFSHQLLRFLDPAESWNPSLQALDPYSADASARLLSNLLDKVLCQRNLQ